MHGVWSTTGSNPKSLAIAAGTVAAVVILWQILWLIAVVVLGVAALAVVGLVLLSRNTAQREAIFAQRMEDNRARAIAAQRPARAVEYNGPRELHLHFHNSTPDQVSEVMRQIP